MGKWPFVSLIWMFLVVWAKECTESNRTTYLRTDGVLINEPPLLTLTDVTLNQCAQKCSESKNGDCRSFEYNAARQSCALKEGIAQPFGRAILVPAAQPGIAFFQQICVSSDNLCAAPYSFERYPQKVLAGNAMEVLNAESLSECLRQCLESRQRMHLDCRSVMYYYESGQCILNREHRKTLPHLFSSDTKFQLVDYFENNCFDVSCSAASNVHWVRMEEFEISADKDVIMDELSADECRQFCTKNVVGNEVFPCKAYVYSTQKRECRLTAETGQLAANTTKKSSAAISSELSSISAGQYFEKYCLDGIVKCKEASFDLIPNRELDARDRVLITPSLSYCLQQCLLLAEECNSAMFFKERDECILNKKSQFSNPDLFRSSRKVDYFDNVCEYETRPPKNVPLAEFSSDAQPQQKLKPMFKPDIQSDEPKRKQKNNILETDCGIDGIVVGTQFESPSSGAIFIKDHSATCRRDFENAIDIRLRIPFPSNEDNNPKCPGIELSPSLWSFIVVLQKNDIGIPSLMTATDRIFNVTCDYSNVTVNRPKEKQRPQLSHDPPKIGFDLDSKGKFREAERVRMSILRNGIPVTTVSLGEELELRWTIDESARKGPDGEPLGFLVEECTAERMDGIPPEPSPLPLIIGGCPDPRIRDRLVRGLVRELSDGFAVTVKVFRFDGSRRVRIRCSINVCVERCESVNCDLPSAPNSTGRRRRQTMKELAELVEQYDQIRNEGNIQKKLSHGEMIEQSTSQGSFTILDEPETSDQSALKTEEETECDENGNRIGNKICLRRTLAIGLLVGIVLLSCSQIFWFVGWIQSRVLQNADNHHWSSSSCGTFGTQWEQDRHSFPESPTIYSRSSNNRPLR